MGANAAAATRGGVRSAVAGRAVPDGRGGVGADFAASCVYGRGKWERKPRPATGGAHEHGAGYVFCARTGSVDGFVPGTATNSGGESERLSQRTGEPRARVPGRAGSDVCCRSDSHVRRRGG